MILIKIKFLLLIFIFYQSPIYSKSNSFDDFNSRNLSKYFSGIIAFENKDNTKALNFFNSSKNLINLHDPYLKRYIYSLVLEDKIPLAIKLIKKKFIQILKSDTQIIAPILLMRVVHLA